MMRISSVPAIMVAGAMLLMPPAAAGQERRAARSRGPAQVLVDRFDRSAPQIGDPLPNVTALDAEGNEFKLQSLRGHYSVLTFGCLT